MSHVFYVLYAGHAGLRPQCVAASGHTNFMLSNSTRVTKYVKQLSRLRWYALVSQNSHHCPVHPTTYQTRIRLVRLHSLAAHKLARKGMFGLACRMGTKACFSDISANFGGLKTGRSPSGPASASVGHDGSGAAYGKSGSGVDFNSKRTSGNAVSYGADNLPGNQQTANGGATLDKSTGAGQGTFSGKAEEV